MRQPDLVVSGWFGFESRILYFCVMIHILGIVNVNGDSFWARSRAGAGDVVRRVETMLEEGATEVDFGAVSSRPGAELLPWEEEWGRLEPALKSVRAAFPELGISVDTWSSEVVRRAFDTVGPFIVNDISAGAFDPAILPVTGKLGLRYIAMHMRGTPKTMQGLTDYTDVVEDVKEYFRGFALKASENGIEDWILDPGFGFAKTVEQNYELLGRLAEFKDFGRPVLAGLSRKSMIWKLCGGGPEDALAGTQVLNYAALERGATWLRVHDVAEAARTVKIYSAMYTSSPGAVK